MGMKLLLKGGKKMQSNDFKEVFVLSRLCRITHALDTKTFSSKDKAVAFCERVFSINPTDWEAFLIRPDSNSDLKYNEDRVSYCGWRTEKDQVFYIHLNEVDMHE